MSTTPKVYKIKDSMYAWAYFSKDRTPYEGVYVPEVELSIIDKKTGNSLKTFGRVSSLVFPESFFNDSDFEFNNTADFIGGYEIEEAKYFVKHEFRIYVARTEEQMRAMLTLAVPCCYKGKIKLLKVK